MPSQGEQGVASGGDERPFHDGGKLDRPFQVDGGELGLWDGSTPTPTPRPLRPVRQRDRRAHRPSNIPLHFFVADGGVGGRSPLPGRKPDTFGVGYFDRGPSDNRAITPWARLAGGLPIARPSRAGLGTAVLPGPRLQILF